MIKVDHLTKRYGTVTAVDDLSFEIEDGHVYGFLGPNGAGKTTTMNIMTGCLSASEGSVTINGCDIFEEPKKAKRKIGYLPEQPPLYMNETPEEYLRFVGEAKGIRGAELKKQIDEAIERTGIGNVRHRRISALSKGYKQRTGIAQALLGTPVAIILDEPTVGLDPIQVIGIRRLIRELGESHTVILSSHILSEVQAICDQILMIAHGRLVAFDSPSNLERTLLTQNEIEIMTDMDPLEAEELIAKLAHVTEVVAETADSGLTIANIKTDYDNIYDMSRTLFFCFAEHGTPLLEMSLKKASLEDVFLELTEDSAQEDAAVGDNAVKREETSADGNEKEVEEHDSDIQA